MDFERDTRGFRNNNPGNIKHGEPWNGLSKDQEDEEFCHFRGVEWGVRAIYKLLTTYHRYYDIKGVRGVIERYAPSSENHTLAYIKFCVGYINHHVKEPITSEVDIFERDLVDLLVASIIHYENGFNPFSVRFLHGCEEFNGT